MKILVIDVAAEYGGAVTILNQFIEEFKKNKENQYIVVLSKLQYVNSENVHFVNCKWVKKSHFHRLFFDFFFVNKLVKKYKPDRVLSLQNNAFSIGNISQDVYFHNALPISEKRFSVFESKKLWIYQNVIGNIVKNSLKNADRIFVQANWIKKALFAKWGLEQNKIFVTTPKIEILQSVEISNVENNNKILFYPANGSIYKNHLTLLQALEVIWRENNNEFPVLILTGKLGSLSEDCQKIVRSSNYPVKFVGRLNQREMFETYKRSTLIFPSYIETIGLPLLEAKALGCQIVAANCEYAHEVLENYDNVVYFNPFSSDELVRCLRIKFKEGNIKNECSQ